MSKASCQQMIRTHPIINGSFDWIVPNLYIGSDPGMHFRLVRVPGLDQSKNMTQESLTYAQVWSPCLGCFEFLSDPWVSVAIFLGGHVGEAPIQTTMGCETKATTTWKEQLNHNEVVMMMMMMLTYHFRIARFTILQNDTGSASLGQCTLHAATSARTLQKPQVTRTALDAIAACLAKR